MSRSDRVTTTVYAVAGDNGIHRDALNGLATNMGLPAPGQNGGLHGTRHPLMYSDGDMRYLTDYAKSRLGL